MWKLLHAGLAGAGAFSAQRGAELMWPEESPWTWWFIAGAVFVLWLLFAYVGSRYFSDREAAKRNPGNGFRVSCLIMKAWTTTAADKIFRDFEAIASSDKTNELDVLAAYGLRMWRTNTGHGGGELACMENMALSRGLGGQHPFLETFKRLEKEFPEPWWSKLLGKRREEIETLHNAVQRILMDNENSWMTTREIADRVNNEGLYKKKYGAAVSARKIHGWTRNYPHLFERDRRNVRCKEE